VDRVWFHIGANNVRSRRAIEAIGAVFDKEIANDPDWSGVSMAYYVIDQRTRKI
jgi:predicted acetyltransferase